MIVYQSALISRKLPCPENFLVTRLYTGASTRAVHLDLIPDLSPTSFIQILKSLNLDLEFQNYLSETMVLIFAVK